MKLPATILLAEPDAAMMELVCDVFAREGFAVVSHSNASSALDAMLTSMPDVLVLDVDAGCRSPFEVMRDVQMLAEQPNAPVVLAWTRSSLGSLWAELSHMCERVIPEPIDPGEVARAVRELAAAAAAKQAAV